jgi:hypothetical protein
MFIFSRVVHAANSLERAAPLALLRCLRWRTCASHVSFHKLHSANHTSSINCILSYVNVTRHPSRVSHLTSRISHHTPFSTVSSAVRTATKGMYFERAATPSSAADDGDSAAAMDWGAGEKTRKYAKVICHFCCHHIILIIIIVVVVVITITAGSRCKTPCTQAVE